MEDKKSAQGALAKMTAEAERIFRNEKELTDLDLDGAGGKTFLRVLLKLIMHDYPPLVSGSLQLLFRHFSQIQETLAAFKQIQLLVSDDDVNNYNKIKTDLDKLRLLVEQSELWIYKKKDTSSGGDEESHTVSKHQKELSRIKKDTNSNVNDFAVQELDNGPEIDESAILKYKELYKILHNMIDLCVTEVNNIKKPRRNDQRLLRNMGVHNIVLDLTKISYEKQEDKRMHIVMKAAHEFLQNFCFANPHNQALLHEKIDFSRFPENEWEAETATFIYRDNTVLCNEISERLIQNFVHALEHQNDGGSKVSYLKFLQTIAICDGHEIKKCQDIIMTEMMNSDIMNFTSDKTHIDDLILMMQKSHSSLHEDPHSEANNQINFQINLIQLLSNCTAGKNTFTEIKCHSILTLEDIEKVVLNKNCLIEVKDAYISFLFHCHIDTENETKEIFTTPFIWSIFENFIQDMSLVCPSRVEREYADRILEKYVGNTMIDVITGFFSHNQFAQIPSPNTRAEIFQILYSKLNQLHRCSWLTEIQKVNINLAIVTMQEKATFMGIIDIPRLEGTSSMVDNRLMNIRAPIQPTMLQKMSSTTSSFPRNRMLSVAGTIGSTSEIVNKFRPTISKTSTYETLKQDTRLVNEAFQV